MGSRLDRLVTLLETGSTSVIRNTAAQQLADVQKAHPDELLNLLSRILPYLRSKSWDARTASAKAIGGIVSNADPFDPNRDDSYAKDELKQEKKEKEQEEVLVKQEVKEEDANEEMRAVKDEPNGYGGIKEEDAPSISPATATLLDPAKLDIAAILTHGQPLLASGGRDHDRYLASMDPNDRLEHQQNTLMQRLGLSDEKIDLSQIFEGQDSCAQPSPRLESVASHDSHTSYNSRHNSTITTPNPGGPSNYNVSESNNGLSKRQLNQLKRKNKLSAKSGASKIRVVDISCGRKGAEALSPQDDTIASPVAVKNENEADASTADSMASAMKNEVFTMDREGPDDDTKLVRDYKGPVTADKSFIQTDRENEGLDWPYERMCVFLIADLFDPAWEIRHGAAMGLREVVRVQGKGAGRLQGKTRSENDDLNCKWLNNLASQLLCVFLLDRFGDFISDNVVAPIRETVGQTLAAVLIHLPAQSVFSIYHVLSKMITQQDLGLERPIWEVCHGGMIGFKYLVAVRTDVLSSDSQVMDGVINAVMKGLGDLDDDVRSVSAATLIPISEDFVRQRPSSLCSLMSIVWDCLSNLHDDLSASIGSVMDLLAKLCTYPAVLEAMKVNATHDPESSFSKLVPRLFPFLRHTITSVRSAVLRALLTFLRLDDASGSKGWADERALRLIFQNILVERNEAVLKLSLDVWTRLLDTMESIGVFNSPREELFPAVHALIKLTMGPFGVPRASIPMDASLLIRPSGLPYVSAPSTAYSGRKSIAYSESPTIAGSNSPSSGRGRRRRSERENQAPPTLAHNVDAHMMDGDVDLVGTDTLIRSKISAAIALGKFLSIWDRHNLPSLWPTIIPFLTSLASTTQVSASMVIEEYAKNYCNTPYLPVMSQPLTQTLEGDRQPWYSDIVNYLHLVRAQCHSLLNAFRDHGHVSASRLPTLAVVVQGDPDAGPSAFSMDDAVRVVGPDYERFKKMMSPAQRLAATQTLTEYHTSAKNAVEESKEVKLQRDDRIRAAAAAAMVSLQSIPKKPSFVIRGIMESIKKESNHELQMRSASAIASLIEYYTNVAVKRGPVDKLIGNLVTFSCVDTAETPEFSHNGQFEEAILSLRKDEDIKDPVDFVAYQNETRRARIMRRGSKESLEQLAVRFGPELLNKVPGLMPLIEEPLRTIFAHDELPSDLSAADGQKVIDGMSVLAMLLPSFHSGLYSWVMDLAPVIAKVLVSRLSVFRYVAAKCFATICSVLTVEGMTMLVEKLLPSISNGLDVHCRQGVMECIYHLIHIMNDRILPYVIFLIVPVLGRMSDSDNDVRLLATTSFATLVKLVPLEAGIPDPEGLSPELLKGRERERKFMEQMLDARKAEPFQIPVAIKAELRSYQQEGVNWLAFLNRYQLHGILCDDMGLGKTLQTICIVASDHHARAEEYAKTQAPELRRLPSLIICPTSLSGHWAQEIKQYAPFLNPVAYVGPPAERSRIREQLAEADIVITSYEVCRNDINVFLANAWNYCVLDEGHLVKNPRAKVSLAVKRIQSNHRLILSGTPIQNNVLELWSLFDFLMPGFLGTEKVFLDRFAKPIAASRFSKSSSKEQEAGALAIEALHKQVLPFLLRRLKEEVLNDLPPKILQNYYCDPSDLQRRLFESFMKEEQKELQGRVGSSDKNDKQHIFQALQYMRKVCNSPSLVLKEGHKKHDEMKQMLEQQGSTIGDIDHAPKLGALRDLLVDCGIGLEPSNNVLDPGTTFISPHRALVFCQMKEMLDIVQNDVFKRLLPSVQYLRLDGSVEATRRQDIVNKFNTDPSYDVLLLTTSVGGLGLNLTGADTVIFVEHDWNPQKDIQAMDRAHRIGQKKVVNVYRLITRGTLEEKILNLQRFKIDVASTVVNQQNAGLASMDTDQLLDLFSLGETTETGAGENKNRGGNEIDMVDIDGELRQQGKKGWLDDVTELWDDKQYEEEYNLDAFMASMNA